MIQIEHLYKTYTSEKHDEAHHALKDINLTIEDGSIFGIIGQSGAGKSTLVRCINLLERPTSGEIIIDGVDVTNLTGKALLEFRANVGMIFQNFSLFQQRTVLRNVTFPLELHKGYNKAEARERALELLELVGLADKANKYPSSKPKEGRFCGTNKPPPCARPLTSASVNESGVLTLPRVSI